MAGRGSSRSRPWSSSGENENFFSSSFLFVDQTTSIRYVNMPYMYGILTYSTTQKGATGMPVIVSRPKRGKTAAPARTAAEHSEVDQRRNSAAKDDADQRAISAARIRDELSRHANPRASQRERKSRRRELRLTPSADDLIRCAMEVSGFTPGELAYLGAQRLLQDHYRGLRVRQRQRDRDRPSRFRR